MIIGGFQLRQNYVDHVYAGPHVRWVLKYQVGLLQTAHSWGNTGVSFGVRIRRGTFQKLSYRDETLAQIASHKKELIDKEIIIIHAYVCEKFKKQKYYTSIQ